VNFIIEPLLSVPLSDWLIAVFGFVSVGIFLIITESARRYFNFPASLTRKFIHIVTGLIVCFVAILLESSLPIQVFSILYIFIDIWSIKSGMFLSIHPDRRSLGTIFYAISVFILASVFWDDLKPLFIITNLIMIVPDAMAAILGERYAINFFIPLSEKKSRIGALTMFNLTFILVFMSILVFYSISIVDNLIISAIIGSIATVSELLSIRGSDNLSVPLLSGLFLFSIFNFPASESLSIGIFAAAVVAYGSYKVKFLDRGGSLLTFIMGSILFGLGGWYYTLPILVFYATSSGFSKVGKQKKQVVEKFYQKSGQRDFYQVLANGGVPTIIFIVIFLSGQSYLYVLYLISIGAAAADTWATELGIFSNKDPFLITNFKSVKPGTSGAISLPGSIASLVASSLIACSGFLFIMFSWNNFFIITLCGFSGSVIDSILGATVQGQYKCNLCKDLTENKEHCSIPTNLIKGKKWLDNDIVNIFSILIAVFIGILLMILL